VSARCEDCGGLIAGTADEMTAQSHGLALCQDCLESMSDEADAYERMQYEDD
jgi:ribosome-binding protein aMBF1 (putative translation factor)